MPNSISPHFTQELGSLFQQGQTAAPVQSASQNRLSTIRNIALGTLGLIAIAATGYYLSQQDWSQQPANIPLPPPTPPEPTLPVPTPTIPLPNGRLPENGTLVPFVPPLFSYDHVAAVGLFTFAGSLVNSLRHTLHQIKSQYVAPIPASVSEIPFNNSSYLVNPVTPPEQHMEQSGWTRAHLAGQRDSRLTLSSHRTAKEVAEVVNDQLELLVKPQKPTVEQKPKPPLAKPCLLKLVRANDGMIDPINTRMRLRGILKANVLNISVNALATGSANGLLANIHPKSLQRASILLNRLPQDEKVGNAVANLNKSVETASKNLEEAIKRHIELKNKQLTQSMFGSNDSENDQSLFESTIVNRSEDVVDDQIKHGSEPQSELLPHDNPELTQSIIFADRQTSQQNQFVKAIFAHVQGIKLPPPENQIPVSDNLEQPNVNPKINMQEVMMRCVDLVRTTRNQIQNREFPTIYPERGLRLKYPVLAVIGSKSNAPMDENEYITPCLMSMQDVSDDDEWKKQELISQKILDEKYKGDFHGVDKGKGGKISLLNIMLEGAGCFNCTGPFGDDSQPQWFAMSHGPSYVMIDSKVVKKQLEEKDPLINRCVHDESTMKAFLVPNLNYVEYFNTHLDHAVEKGFIENDEAFRMKQKLITYDEFLGLEEGLICKTAEFKERLTKLNNERASLVFKRSSHFAELSNQE